MEDFSKSVMIALLPVTSEWCKIDCPHMTLVYAGEIPDLPIGAFNEIAKDASMLAALSKPITLRAMGVEIFGDEDKVDVLRMQPSPELLAMRRSVQRWNASQYDFNPHVTIGPVGSMEDQVEPIAISFNKIMVGWGTDQLVFNLNY